MRVPSRRGEKEASAEMLLTDSYTSFGVSDLLIALSEIGVVW